MQQGDRRRSKAGTDFQSMRQKARSGSLSGKTYREDRFDRAPTTDLPHGKRDMTRGVQQSPLVNDGTGHDPATKRYPEARKTV